MKLYQCALCSQILAVVEEGAGWPECCGEKMILLEANRTDGAKEKHVPSVTRDASEVYVAVGEKEHPMTETHRIVWVALKSDRGWYVRKMNAKDRPYTVFSLPEKEEVEAVYAYCNLHGLWVREGPFAGEGRED